MLQAGRDLDRVNAVAARVASARPAKCRTFWRLRIPMIDVWDVRGGVRRERVFAGILREGICVCIGGVCIIVIALRIKDRAGGQRAQHERTGEHQESSRGIGSEAVGGRFHISNFAKRECLGGERCEP